MLSSNPRPDTNELKNRVDLREFVADLWGEPQRRGPNYSQYFSPWRDDGRKASLTVYPESFFDFGGSGEKGDVFDLIQRERNLSFPEAVEWVTQYLGHLAPTPSKQPRQEARSAASEPPSTDWQQRADRSLRQFQNELWADRPDAQAIRDYLHQERGLCDNIIQQLGLGYNPRWQHFSKDKKIARGIVIPIYVNEALWALRVRTLDDTLDKYLNAPDSHLSGSLFNADSIQPGRPVLFVEGEFDAMLAHQELSDFITVITLGSASNPLSNRWREALQTTGDIYICLDNDAPGQKAARELAKTLSAWGKTSYNLTVPQGKDITEFVVEHGGDLRAWFGKAPGRCWWPEGVPDSYRSAMLNYVHDRVAVVVELLNEAMRSGWIDPYNFTFAGVKHVNRRLGYDIPDSSLAKALKDLDGVFISKLETLKRKKNTGSKTEKNASPGRKTIHYHIRSVSEIKETVLAYAKTRIYERLHPTDTADPVLALFTEQIITDTAETDENPKELAEDVNRSTVQLKCKPDPKRMRRARRQFEALQEELDNLPSTPLPKSWPKSNASEFRAAYAHAFVRANPNVQLSRRQIKNKFGISNEAIGALIKRAGLEGMAQKTSAEITNPDNIAAQVRELAIKLKGYPLRVTIRQGPQKWSIPYVESNTDLLAEALRKGAKAEVELQQASRYRVIREAPPVQEAAARQWVTSVQDERIAVDEPPPAKPEKLHYGPTHDPRWVAGQLKLRLEPVDAGLLNPLTGEIVSPDATVTELLECLLGRPIRRQSSVETTPKGEESSEPSSQPPAD